MAKKATTPKAAPAAKSAAAPAASAPVSTPVRNSAVPPKSAAAAAAPAPKREITQEQIAVRAYLISRSGTGGSEQDNWFRAERELRAGL